MSTAISSEKSSNQEKVSGSGIDPEVVAIITAAVHLVLGKNNRIISIKTRPSSLWVQEGRRQQFQNKI